MLVTLRFYATGSLQVLRTLSSTHMDGMSSTKSAIQVSTKLLRKAFTTYVRPLLEYNTYIWSPFDVGSITKIERVQRHFTKRIPSVSTLCYNDRLKTLGLDSLEYHRLRYDLVMMYKIVHNLVDLDDVTMNSVGLLRLCRC